MSVLDIPAPGEVSRAERTAEQLKSQVRATYQQLVAAFNSGAELFWRDPLATPAEIAEALGTDAKEIFELHAKIGSLIGSVKPEAIAPGVAVVGQFTYNADGSVTVVE